MTLQGKKYSRGGVTRVLWLKTVVHEGHVPTRPELTVGTDLTNAIAAIDGWPLSNQAIETPDLGSTFESKIPGTDQADDTSLGFYEEKVSDEIEQLLKKDDTGWFVFLRKGDVPASKSMDIRAVTTTLANTALWDAEMDARRAQFAGVLTDRLAAALDEAEARGEVTLTLASRNAAALAIGPLYYRSTIERAPADPDLIEAAVAALGTWSTG